MGEGHKEAFQVGFDRSVKIEFQGAHVTSDASSLAFRELDEAFGLPGMAAEFLTGIMWIPLAIMWYRRFEEPVGLCPNLRWALRL